MFGYPKQIGENKKKIVFPSSKEAKSLHNEARFSHLASFEVIFYINGKTKIVVFCVSVAVGAS